FTFCFLTIISIPTTRASASPQKDLPTSLALSLSASLSLSVPVVISISRLGAIVNIVGSYPPVCIPPRTQQPPSTCIRRLLTPSETTDPSTTLTGTLKLVLPFITLPIFISPYLRRSLSTSISRSSTPSQMSILTTISICCCLPKAAATAPRGWRI
ncbi:hypothetical protein V8E55_010486, partial [Tylopilus felleus]